MRVYQPISRCNFHRVKIFPDTCITEAVHLAFILSIYGWAIGTTARPPRWCITWVPTDRWNKATKAQQTTRQQTSYR